MSLTKKITFLFILVFSVSLVNAQSQFPETPKSFDIKYLKGKRIYVPVVEKLPTKLQEEDAFKGITLDRLIDEEYEKRWKEGYDKSLFDILDFEIVNFNSKTLKKEKDKVAVMLDLQKDFYENWTANLIVTEPKYELIASAPINGLKLTNPDDIALMFNMLHYSLIRAANYYGDDAKPLYKGHKNKYKVTMNEFSDDLKKRKLLVPKYGSKDMSNYKKINDKTETFLKEEWKVTSYEMLKKDELKKKLESEGFTGYYIREFDIKTDNPKFTLKYFMIMRADNNAVIFDVKGNRELRFNNLKYLQPKMEEWLYYFMDLKKRRAYDVAKEKEAMKAQQKTSSKKSSAKASPKKNEPVKKAEGKATKSKR